MNARTAELVRHLNTSAITNSAESYPGMHKLRSLRAAATLRDPFINEDTGFPVELRQRMGIRGLLPPAIETLDQQMARVLDQMRTKRTSIGQYIYLSNLRQSNVNLFYHVLLTNTSEVVPLVYTPVVGEACTKWSHIYQRPEGLYVSWNDRGSIREVLKNWPMPEEARICVVTDGSRILGTVGRFGSWWNGNFGWKIVTLCGCCRYSTLATLPICMDLGTDNEKNLTDPLYLGLRMKRRSKEEALEFMDEFMDAVHTEFPELVIQHEDFATERAFDYLKRYQHSYPMFNDDIQGTGAVILGGFINAARHSASASEKNLRDQRIVFMGAGSAGSELPNNYSHFYQLGFSEEEAKERVWLVDTKGLVTADRGDKLAAHKTFFARQAGGPQIKSLIDVIQHVKPTALIGLAATANLFDEAVVKLMAEINPRPIIFPSPILESDIEPPFHTQVHLAECTFEEAVKWTDGKVLFASGSPFASCGWRGQTIEPGQGNNMYVFPGIGLGAILARVKTISDKMIEASALALSDAMTDEEKSAGLLYPRLNRIRDISTSVALRVIRQAQEEGLVGNPVVGNLSDDELRKYIEQKEYWPAFMSGEHIDLAIRS
ncbi:hypothetical protein H4Q26_000582 [Puccinia striiformis f. sp. tritici PST-130]|nr:hypothetical protein H4Q26_000582 [Puccinia striiformis f. sp. tritici PST-130]